MLCDICHKREAKIYYTEIINGEKKDQHLCEECAAEHTSFQVKMPVKGEFTLGNLLSSILQGYYNNEEQKQEENANPNPVCPRCGMSYEEFLKTGLLGCADCYKSFGSAILGSLKNIQGSELHTGKRPKGYVKVKEVSKPIKELSEIDKLTIRLQQAVEREEFEEAARLRDEIRARKAQEEKEEAQKEGAPNA